MVSIKKRVGQAQALPNDTVGNSEDHTDWKNFSFIAQSNNLYASADFADGTGDEISNFIHLFNFGFNLPSEIAVEGIELILEKSASGTIQDEQVRLSWDDVSMKFTIPKSKLGNWPSTDTLDTYGSSTDVWNRTWSAINVNDTNFGAIVAVEGSLGDSAAFIDSAEIEVYYHMQYDEVGGNGVKCGGTAVVQSNYNPVIITTGISTGGIGVQTYNEDIVGGILAAGEAEVLHSYFGDGGAVVAGEGEVQFTGNIDVEGGVVVNGGSPEYEDEAPQGGITVGGIAPFTAAYYGQGGIVLAGTVVENSIIGPTPAGGVEVNGSAFVDPVLAVGGATVGGLATIWIHYNLLTTPTISVAGILTGGQGLISHSFEVTGGVQIGSSAFSGFAHNIPKWEFELNSSQLVTSPSDSTATAYAEFWLADLPKGDIPFGGFYLLGWNITYQNISSRITSVTTNGPANENEVALPLFNLLTKSLKPIGDRDSPITGQVFVTEAEKNFILGLKGTYVVIATECWPFGEIRGNVTQPGIVLGGEAVSGHPFIARGGVNVGGAALDTPYLNIGSSGVVIVSEECPQDTAIVNSSEQRIGAGGITCSGIASISLVSPTHTASGGVNIGVPPINPINGLDEKVQWIFKPPIGGGIIINGLALRIDAPLTNKAAVSAGGEALIEFFIYPRPTGGMVAGGQSLTGLKYDEFGQGGMVAAGNWIVAIGWVSQGGVVVTGSPVEKWIFNRVGSGGAKTGGIARQTFFDYEDMTGGVSVRPKIRVEKLRELPVSKKLGIGNALKSSNILNIPVEKPGLIPPTDDVAPELDENRFRISHFPTWCELIKTSDVFDQAQKESECDAGLAPITTSNQKGIVPQKSGRKQVVDTLSS